ncbi:MAG: RelA/SpoT protein [uncultured bacterium]|nr:MAG: RelA/SpoT protein [uncultured bacterium]
MEEVQSYYELMLEKDGIQAENELLAALQQSGIFKKCYAHKSRVKPEKKLVEKIERKRKEKLDYNLQCITDVVGIRLVTLFRADMPSVFETILDIINHNYSLDPNPFLKEGLEEVTIYYTNPNDNIRHLIKAIALKTNLGVKIEEKLSPEEYSSIHIVARLKKRVPGLDIGSNQYFIPVEIQIRTVFEDAWGEIDHKYGYVSRTGKEVGNPIANPENVLHHLKVMKKFSDACAEYADAILMEATPKPDKVIDNSKILSVFADDDVIKTFHELGVDSDDITTYLSARDLRSEAEKLEEKERAGGFELFLQAGELFRELSVKYEAQEINSDNRKHYLFYYYVKMNESLCLLRTNRQEYVNIAHSNYEFLLEHYQDFPLLKMRFGQSCGKLGRLEDALTAFEGAYIFLTEFEKNGVVFSDSIPKIDYEHIKTHLPKVYGYYLWKKSDALNPNITDQANHKIELLSKAYDITNETLKLNPDMTVLHNNQLYYAVSICEIANVISEQDKYKYIIDSIEYHLSEVEKKCDLETCEDIDVLDTLLKAFDYIGKKDSLLKIIDRIVPIAEKALSTNPCDREVMLQIQSSAIILKLKYGC